MNILKFPSLHKYKVRFCTPMGRRYSSILVLARNEEQAIERAQKDLEKSRHRYNRDSFAAFKITE